MPLFAILDLRPDVFVVTATTPPTLLKSQLALVPVLLHARPRCDAWLTSFGEAVRSGSLGTFESRHLMALMLAHAQRLAVGHDRTKQLDRAGRFAHESEAALAGDQPG